MTLEERIEAAEGSCAGVQIEWKDRDGSWCSLFVLHAPLSEVQAAARQMGWPGHKGGFWNYLKDDLRRMCAAALRARKETDNEG